MENCASRNIPLLTICAKLAIVNQDLNLRLFEDAVRLHMLAMFSSRSQPLPVGDGFNIN